MATPTLAPLGILIAISTVILSSLLAWILFACLRVRLRERSRSADLECARRHRRRNAVDLGRPSSETIRRAIGDHGRSQEYSYQLTGRDEWKTSNPVHSSRQANNPAPSKLAPPATACHRKVTKHTTDSSTLEDDQISPRSTRESTHRQPQRIHIPGSLIMQLNPNPHHRTPHRARRVLLHSASNGEEVKGVFNAMSPISEISECTTEIGGNNMEEEESVLRWWWSEHMWEDETR
jgi:hypothetical protein